MAVIAGKCNGYGISGNLSLTKPWGSAGKFITTENYQQPEKQNSGGRKVLGLPKPHPP